MRGRWRMGRRGGKGGSRVEEGKRGFFFLAEDGVREVVGCRDVDDDDNNNNNDNSSSSSSSSSSSNSSSR